LQKWGDARGGGGGGGGGNAERINKRIQNSKFFSIHSSGGTGQLVFETGGKKKKKNRALSGIFYTSYEGYQAKKLGGRGKNRGKSM